MVSNVNLNERIDCKTCLKIQNELVDNLNVAVNLKNNKIVFWNKYQIFFLDDDELDGPLNVQNFRLVSYNTDFEIHQLVVAKNLLCVDNEGNLFAYPLIIKQTAAAQKRSRHSFQQLERNILRIEWYEDILFSLQLEMDELYLRIEEINPTDNGFISLKLFSKNEIANKNVLHLPNNIKSEKCILCCYRVNKSDYDSIKHIFRGKKILSHQQFIIIVSFDKLTLYAVLVDLESNGNTLSLVKILTCPSEINSVVPVKENFLNLIISLISGTVIKQPLNINFNTPIIAHLNTAIHKFIVLNDKFIYSDGITMWVSTNTFSEPDTKLRQLFARRIKDFTHADNIGKMVCTTYSRLVYIFHINDESCYLSPITASEYYLAEHLFNNMSYLHRIMDEVEKNDDIIKEIKKEENYITTLALSNRQDVMNEIIKIGVNVYENYEDILRKGLVLNLTNNLEEYFVSDSFFFLITLAAVTQNFDDVLENIFTDSKIYVTILSEHKNIKTICMKVMDQLKTFNIAVPLKMTKLNITDICLDIKIVKKIPKVLNSKQNLWTALYCKQVTVTPEHFIKTNISSDNVRLLKNPEVSIQHLLYKTSFKHYGHLFRITKVSEDFLRWSFYIKLPNTYKDIMQNEMIYKQHFNSTQAKYLLKEISSEEFLNSRKNISIMVANEKVDIKVIQDGGFSYPLSTNMIKVSGANPLLALGIRNFFSNLVHNNFLRYQPGQEFLNCFKIISTLEKIEKGVKKCIDERLPFEEFFKIYEQYQIILCETLV